jgi:hypothetical protein
MGAKGLGCHPESRSDRDEGSRQFLRVIRGFFSRSERDQNDTRPARGRGLSFWMPAFAGMTGSRVVTPAQAGVQWLGGWIPPARIGTGMTGAGRGLRDQVRATDSVFVLT